MPRRSTIAFGLTAFLASIAPAIAADSYTIDGVHSSVIFRVKHMDVSYAYGRFNDVKGSFTLSPNPAEMGFDAVIGVESIDTGNAAREKHLKGPDFFNAKQFPTITFKSTSVKRPNPSAPYEVVGDLTLHGVTKPVTLKLEPTGTAKGRPSGTIAGLEGKVAVKRSEFGMTGMIGPVGDEIDIIISLEGKRP